MVENNVVKLALPPVTKEYVEKLRKEAEAAHTKYLLLKDQATRAESEYLEKSKRFRDLDYQLALVDGRMKKVESGEKKGKKVDIGSLSLDDILSLAAQLGVSLERKENGGEDEDEPEEQEGEEGEVE